MSSIEKFMKCEKCGKKLLALTDTGLWYFAFGRMLDENREVIVSVGDDSRMHPVPAVEMKVQGVIRMKCFRVECRRTYPDHWNELHLFEG